MRNLTNDEIKNIQLDILRNYASYCEKNGLTYYLAYGTLIGAVRHHGYIPWDDDIDVIMPRPDYERFIREYRDERYKVFCPEFNKDCPCTYGKLYDSNTVLKELSSRKYDIGLNIDIFILDGLPRDIVKAQKHIKKCSFWINILDVKKIAFRKERSFLRNLKLLILKSLVFLLPYRTIRNKIISLNKKYNFMSSSFCSDMCYTGALHLPKEVFGIGKKMLFEDREYTAPENYGFWLKGVYGDYMQLPPVEKRISHHVFKAYWK